MIVLRNQLEVQATSYQLPAATSSYQDMLLLLAELNLLDVLEHCDSWCWLLEDPSLRGDRMGESRVMLHCWLYG